MNCYKDPASIAISIATPPELLEAITQRYGIDHDPCPLHGHLNGPDGLDRSIPWGKSNYINPPYLEAGITGFVDRAIEEMGRGNNSYFLMPMRAHLRYFKKAMQNCTGVLYFHTGVKFVGYSHVFPQQLALFEFEAGKPPLYETQTLGKYEVFKQKEE